MLSTLGLLELHALHAQLPIRSLRPPKGSIRINNWACKASSSRTFSTSWYRRSTSTTGPAIEKPYYATTPIFYVNAAPHVGHLYTMVLTDILKRWQELKGRKAVLCTGTDEHGMKIQQAAMKAQKEPREFCDSGAEVFRKLANRAELSNEHFVRTSDEDHKQAVQYAWYLLKERGFIYASKHEGWYCVSDETFYPQSTIEKRLDPFNGRTFMASQETGKEVEWTSEPNYHFRLSMFKDKLLQFYAENPNFIVPESRMKDVVRWVSEGLEDLSVSRPADRLTWGVQVPDDPTQTIYVWLDALMNYATKVGYPWAPGTEQQGGWPADVQVIGKDIVRFHCIYWPAFLMALEMPLPKQILTHAHWTLNRKKMAKSTGNVVNPFFAIDRFGIDTMRYYLAHDGGITNDSDYGNEQIVDRYKKGLQGGLGNLVSRVTRPKAWKVADAVHEASKHIDAGSSWQWNGSPSDSKQRNMIAFLRGAVEEEFLQLNPRGALHRIMDLVYETNRYLEERAPWQLVKQDVDQAEVHNVVYNAAEAIRVVGILLQPYMPSKAGELLDMLGVEDSHRTFDMATYAKNSEYGKAKARLGKCAWDGLFPPLAVED